MADIKKNSDHVKKESWSCRPAEGSHLHRNLVSWSMDYDVHRNQWEKLKNPKNEFSCNLLGKKLSEAGGYPAGEQKPTSALGLFIRYRRFLLCAFSRSSLHSEYAGSGCSERENSHDAWGQRTTQRYETSRPWNRLHATPLPIDWREGLTWTSNQSVSYDSRPENRLKFGYKLRVHQPVLKG